MEVNIKDEKTQHIPIDLDFPPPLIAEILGWGLTVFAALEYHPDQLRVVMRQAALALADGGLFLGRFKAEKSKVLWVANSPADARHDRIAMPNRNIKVVEELPRVGKGLTSALRVWRNQGFKVAFLGWSDSVFDRLSAWVKMEYDEKVRDTMNAGSGAFEGLRRDMELENIRKLLDFASEPGMALVIAHHLTTRGHLKNTVGLHRRDGEIHLTEDGGQWALRTIGGDQIPSKRHELAPNNGGFECAAESPGANTENKKPPSGPRRKGQAAGKAAAKAALVRQYLTANAGRFSRRQLVEGCGDDWNDPKVRAAYNDALRRGLKDEVTKHPVDAEYSEITYSLKEVAG